MNCAGLLPPLLCRSCSVPSPVTPGLRHWLSPQARGQGAASLDCAPAPNLVRHWQGATAQVVGKARPTSLATVTKGQREPSDKGGPGFLHKTLNPVHCVQGCAGHPHTQTNGTRALAWGQDSRLLAQAQGGPGPAWAQHPRAAGEVGSGEPDGEAHGGSSGDPTSASSQHLCQARTCELSAFGG